MTRWLTAGAIVALLAVAGWLGWRWQQVDQRASSRGAAIEVAADFAEALLSYDHADPEGSLAPIETLATDAFAEEYRTRFTDELLPVIEEAQASASAEAREVYLGQVDGDEVAAIVLVHATISNPDGTRETDTYLKVSLERVDGTWKVSDAAGVSSFEAPAP